MENWNNILTVILAVWLLLIHLRVGRMAQGMSKLSIILKRIFTHET